MPSVVGDSPTNADISLTLAFVARLARIRPARRACWFRGGAWRDTTTYQRLAGEFAKLRLAMQKPSFRAYLGRTDSVPRLQRLIRREVRKRTNLAPAYDR
jgi:hypothetical protein